MKPNLVHVYTDDNGRELYIKCRCYVTDDKKEFVCYYPDHKTVVQAHAAVFTQAAPYNYATIRKVRELADANGVIPTFYAVEGEKCVDCLTKDLTAWLASVGRCRDGEITPFHGVLNLQEEVKWSSLPYCEMLLDANVVIIPDGDKPGTEEMVDFAEAVELFARRLYKLDLKTYVPDLGPKGDVVDVAERIGWASLAVKIANNSGVTVYEPPHRDEPKGPTGRRGKSRNLEEWKGYLHYVRNCYGLSDHRQDVFKKTIAITNDIGVDAAEDVMKNFYIPFVTRQAHATEAVAAAVGWVRGRIASGHWKFAAKK